MIKPILTVVVTLLLFDGCTQRVAVETPAGYDLARPEVLKMPASLNEISGIAFNSGSPDTIYAEQDEEGRLFYFPTASLDVKHKKFGKKGDYEDIAISHGTIVILRSDGGLISFPLNLTTDEEITDAKELLPNGEYEAMYADETAGLLYVLCKDCQTDNAAKSITGYILAMAPGKDIELKGNFQVNTKNIATKLNEKKIMLRPSALAKNKHNEWYILSSVNKLLVVADDKWEIKGVYPLDPALFPQPEGIAFDKNDNLYISNERAGTPNATVLKFIFANDKK
ncbi:MAG: SdiA-regulated domain-containing protein [Ferruginibacter sp.]